MHLLVLAAFLGICLLPLVRTQQASNYCPSTYYVKSWGIRTYYVRCCRGTRWGYGICQRQKCFYFQQAKLNPKTCCKGWRGPKCNIPICTPPCQATGICIAPDTCKCPSNLVGNRCQTVSCAYDKDCYPGTCDASSATTLAQRTCGCADGYGGTNCQNMLGAPDITECSVRLLRGVNGEEITVLSRDCQREPVFSNMRDITSIRMDWAASYTAQTTLPDRPTYVTEFNVGIIRANASIVLLDRVGTVVSDDSFLCSTSASQNAPKASISCVNNRRTFTQGITQAQELKISLGSGTGGFKKVRNTDNQQIFNLDFSGEEAAEYVQIQFDIDSPKHCTATNTCPGAEITDAVMVAPNLEELTDMGTDITKSATVSVGFFGWNDTYSGLDKMYFDVYAMTKNGEGNLQEDFDPIHTGEMDLYQDEPAYPTFKLPKPGIYSFIGRIVDRANNTAMARSLVLYDDKSKITRTNKTISVEGAARTEQGVYWRHATVGSYNISWNGHFQNTFLVDNDILQPIRPFSRSFADAVDDTSGNLTKDGRPQLLKQGGIEDFGYATQHPTLARPGSGGGRAKRQVDYAEPAQWTDLRNPIDSVLLDQGGKDGDSFQFWVKGRDMLGNSMSAYIPIGFDSTPPFFAKAVVTPSVTHEGSTFYTGLDIFTHDLHSGISMLSYVIKDVHNPNNIKEIKKDGFLGQVTNEDPDTCLAANTCICTTLHCFTYPQRVPINNCWLKDSIGRKLQIDFTVYNGAWLHKNSSVEVPEVNSSWPGFQYPAVRRVSKLRDFDTVVTLEFFYGETCFARKAVRLRVQDDTRQVHSGEILGSTTEYTVRDLYPGKTHTGEAVVEYENGQLSEPYTFQFTSGGTGGLGGGAIAGIIIGLLILLVIIIICILLFIRWRSHQPLLPTRVQNYRQTIVNRFSRVPHGGVVVVDNPYVHSPNNKHSLNVAYPSGPKLHYDEEDIYAYGEMETDPNAQWKHNGDQLSLGRVVATGRFAEIVKAALRDKNGLQQVAAKRLKAGASDYDVLLMKAKMNFLATAVPNHLNIVNFVGAVVNGPMILLEFCDYVLRAWLKDQKKVTDEVADEMINFATDIARGMEHLAKHDIVHRRLGTRNVLLKDVNGRLVAKLSGFGPMKGEVDDADTAESSKERVPIKWLAPEQLGVKSGEKRPYNESTDVWSYGVTLWEIFSKGEAPYAGTGNKGMKKTLDEGFRLPIPEDCPPDMYEQIMEACWKRDPQNRPKFEDIFVMLRKLFHNMGGDGGDDAYYGEDYTYGGDYIKNVDDINDYKDNYGKPLNTDKGGFDNKSYNLYDDTANP